MSAPGSAEWSRRMTASKVAGVLGLSKWASPYSTWLRMKGLLPSDDGRNADAKAREYIAMVKLNGFENALPVEYFSLLA